MAKEVIIPDPIPVNLENGIKVPDSFCASFMDYRNEEKKFPIEDLTNDNNK